MTDMLTIFAAIWGGSTLLIIGIAAAARAFPRLRAHLLPADQADSVTRPAHRRTTNRRRS